MNDEPKNSTRAATAAPMRRRGASSAAALRRAFREFSTDGITDWAAALTYYAVLSIFPGMLVLISLLGLLGDSTTNEVRRILTELAPGEARGILDDAIVRIQENSSTAGLVAIIGLVAAFWSASGYIAAFMRASNVIYDVPEGRPIWKTLPIRIAVTAAVGLMLIASVIIVVFTGSLAERIGELVGLGDTAVTVWNIAKWPGLLILVSLIFALLYWASPNARQGGFWRLGPGGIVAVLGWLAISVGFALYVANFGSYNKVYGAFASVIVFLVWLWLSNIAILFGAELDAELERSRFIAAGHEVDEEPYVELRDDRVLRRKERKARKARASLINRTAPAAGGDDVKAGGTGERTPAEPAKVRDVRVPDPKVDVTKSVDGKSTDTKSVDGKSTDGKSVDGKPTHGKPTVTRGVDVQTARGEAERTGTAGTEPVSTDKTPAS